MFDDGEADSALGEELGGSERLVQHHRPVREEDRVVALAKQPPRARARPRRGARSAAATARSRAGSRRSPSASSTAQRSSARVSSALPGCTIVRFGSAASSEMSRTRLVRLPGPCRDEPGVVQRIDDLRPLARLVVDLLVRPRREERRERVDDRAAGRDARAPPPSRPCPARRSRTRRSGPGRRARRRGRGSRRRGRRRGRRGRRARRRGGRARRRMRRRRTRR